MAGLAATNSATPSLQSTLIRSRLDAARREAEQAQATVNDLRAQVDAAEAESQKRQDKVRTLNGEVRQADPTYNAKIQESRVPLPVKTQASLFGLFSPTEAKRLASDVIQSTNPIGRDVINGQGQNTGRIINLSA